MSAPDFKQLLEGATPGEWFADDPHDGCCGQACTVDGCHESHPVGERVLVGPPSESELRFNNTADALYIARLSPAVMRQVYSDLVMIAEADADTDQQRFVFTRFQAAQFARHALALLNATNQ